MLEYAIHSLYFRYASTDDGVSTFGMMGEILGELADASGTSRWLSLKI